MSQSKQSIPASLLLGLVHHMVRVEPVDLHIQVLLQLQDLGHHHVRIRVMGLWNLHDWGLLLARLVQ